MPIADKPSAERQARVYEALTGAPVLLKPWGLPRSPRWVYRKLDRVGRIMTHPVPNLLTWAKMEWLLERMRERGYGYAISRGSSDQPENGHQVTFSRFRGPRKPRRLWTVNLPTLPAAVFLACESALGLAEPETLSAPDITRRDLQRAKAALLFRAD